MAVFEIEDRMAILLHLLGEAFEPSLGQLPPSQAAEVRRRELQIQDRPPAPDDIEQVLNDFERTLQWTAAPENSPLRLMSSSGNGRFASEDGDDAEAHATGRPHRAGSASRNHPAQAPFEPSDDPLADLERLSCQQVAGALKDETPRTAAFVLACLPADRAAEILQLIPEPVRSGAFLQLSHVEPLPRPLLLCAVRTTVARAAAFEVAPEEHLGGDHKMVEMLRAMSRKMRGQLLELIDRVRPEVAERLRLQLFCFGDLLRIEARSLQKLLLETETQTLLSAMRNAAEEIVDKIMGNVPRRTREALLEEMQYQPPLSEEAIEAARSEIVRLMADLDQQGQLVLEE